MDISANYIWNPPPRRKKEAPALVYSDDLSEYVFVKEGDVEVFMHTDDKVFFSKSQVNNRDISVAVLRTFINKRKQEHEVFLSSVKSKPSNAVPDSEELHTCNIPETEPNKDTCGCDTRGRVEEEFKPPKVLEAMSATGIKALRFALQAEGVGKVVALDNDKAAVEACRRNIKFNGSTACANVEPHLGDAREYMRTHLNEFDVVDLDPYGSPSEFLDTAVQCVVDGGMLMCTATDMKGKISRYYPGYGPIVPQKCSDCGMRFKLGGPIWSARIHNQEWVTSILSDVKDTKSYYPAYNRIVGVLTTVLEELPDVPLSFCLHSLCGTMKCEPPSTELFKTVVRYVGYQISRTHTTPLGLKTNAPMSVIWDIIRCWVQHLPPKPEPANERKKMKKTAQLSSNRLRLAILSKKPQLQVDFTQFTSQSKVKVEKVARFVPNPESFWGPGLRARREIRIFKHCTSLGDDFCRGLRIKS